MVLKADGQTVEGKGAFTKTAGNEAVYEGIASVPVANIKTRLTTEYDGCVKVELTLLPGASRKGKPRA